MKVKCGTCGKEFELKENSQRILVGENNSEKIINICETCDKKIIEILAKKEIEEAAQNASCEYCNSPYLDDREKIIYQGMEFCDINCFISSGYFDIRNLDIIKHIQEEYSILDDDFKKSEETKTKIETLNKVAVDKIEELIEKYDSEFETGNKELDEVLLAILDIQRELRYDD